MAKPKQRKTTGPGRKEPKLKADLERYRQMALDMGAEDAAIIPISHVTQRLRARLGDIWPRCTITGTSYFRDIVEQIPWEDAKAILSSYRFAIIARMPYGQDNPNDFTGPSAMGELVTDIQCHKRYWVDEQVRYWEGVQERRGGSRPTVQVNISRAIVDQARKDGHYFAFSGSSGTCAPLCDAYGRICVAIRTGICRMPGKTTPCGTAAIMGLDHPGIYAKLGWKNWLQGWSIFPEDYPGGRPPTNPSPARTTIVFIE